MPAGRKPEAALPSPRGPGAGPGRWWSRGDLHRDGGYLGDGIDEARSGTGRTAEDPAAEQDEPDERRERVRRDEEQELQGGRRSGGDGVQHRERSAGQPEPDAEDHQALQLVPGGALPAADAE